MVRCPAAFLTATIAMAAAGCGGRSGDSTLLRESFGSVDTYSRTFDAAADRACEAGRRALLSQGYAIARAGADAVEGSKNFQPREESHEQLVLRVSCVADEGRALVFVSAVQDRYALKKSPTSASVGVGALGSVSLPFGGNDDSLVRVASSTVQDPGFYRHFFDRLAQYLAPATLPQEAAGPER